jgi:hypothetical protein
MALEPPSFSSRDVDEFLLQFHEVPDGEREGYLLRLRNITRLGFPAGVSGGKGHPARYAADHFFQLVAATELYRCHILPKPAVDMVQMSWPDMRASILSVWRRRDAAQDGIVLDILRTFWRVPAEGGQRATRTADVGRIHPSQRITVVSREEINRFIDETDRRTHCHIFIDVEKLIDGVFDLLKWGAPLLREQQIALFMAGMEEDR